MPATATRTEVIESLLWDSEKRNSPYSTVADISDESYCEGCDQDVDYTDGSDHGKCGCAVA